MTSKLNMMTVLRYGFLWEFLTVPDSVGTRPFIVPLSDNSESSSILSSLSTPVSGRTHLMNENGLPDVSQDMSVRFQTPESSLDISCKTIIPYDTVEKKGNRFFTPWGRSEADYPESIILHPGDNTNILLFKMNSYFTNSSILS